MAEPNKPLILLVCDTQHEHDYKAIVESLDCRVTTMSEEYMMFPGSAAYSPLSSDFLKGLIQRSTKILYGRC